MSMFVTFGWYI